MATTRPKIKELRAMPDAELAATLEGLRQALWQQRGKVRDGSSQQTHEVTALKRQIARILTVRQEQGAQRRG